jgi:hypothetical protein
MPLPVSRKIDALPALHCQRGYAAHLITIRDAAVNAAYNYRRAELPT